MTGCLSIVATPIGNLEDITLRALRVLREADLILAEDTRHTRKLCSHHAIDTKLRAFHAHSSGHAIEQCVTNLREGLKVALVSDAGTPLISDPGGNLVQAIRAEGLQVEAIPGPSAVATALCVSGVPFDSYRFVGFLPRTGGKRSQAIERIRVAREATVLFESPRRTAHTVTDLLASLGPERQIALCRELTKLHEEVRFGKLSDVNAELASSEVRGEVTMVIEGDHGGTQSAPSQDNLDDDIRTLLASGSSARDIARQLAQKYQVSRRPLYQRVLDLSE